LIEILLLCFTKSVCDGSNIGAETRYEHRQSVELTYACPSDLPDVSAITSHNSRLMTALRVLAIDPFMLNVFWY